MRMIDVGITRMSTKGQIVIPAEMRDDFDVGEKLVIIKTDEQMIIKKASELSKNLEEDVEFAKRTEEALKRYEAGEFAEMDLKEFMRKARTW